jgi:hypothetical protein
VDRGVQWYLNNEANSDTVINNNPRRKEGRPPNCCTTVDMHPADTVDTAMNNPRWCRFGGSLCVLLLVILPRGAFSDTDTRANMTAGWEGPSGRWRRRRETRHRSLSNSEPNLEFSALESSILFRDRALVHISLRVGHAALANQMTRCCTRACRSGMS